MIFFQIRLPRVLMGLLAGGTLAMAGAALQVMFRNPLAEPWTLGIAGGASLGAFIARVCPFLWFALGPLNTSQALALAGAAGALGLVLSLARRPGGAGAQTLLLAGVTIGVISGGAIMVISGFISPWKLAEFHRWLLGGLDAADWRPVGALATLAVPGIAILALHVARLQSAGARRRNGGGAGGRGRARAPLDGHRRGHRLRRRGRRGRAHRIRRVARARTPCGGSSAPTCALVMPCSFLFGGALLAAVRRLGPLGRRAAGSARRRPDRRPGRPAVPLAPRPSTLI